MFEIDIDFTFYCQTWQNREHTIDCVMKITVKVTTCVQAKKKPKTWVSENFGPISKSEAFLMGLKVSFSGDFGSRSLEFCRPRVSGSRICRFFFPVGPQESSFSEFIG